MFSCTYTTVASPCVFSGIARVSLGGNRSQRARGSEEGSAVRVCGRSLPRRIGVTENWLTWAAGAQTAGSRFKGQLSEGTQASPRLM